MASLPHTADHLPHTSILTAPSTKSMASICYVYGIVAAQTAVADAPAGLDVAKVVGRREGGVGGPALPARAKARRTDQGGVAGDESANRRRDSRRSGAARARFRALAHPPRHGGGARHYGSQRCFSRRARSTAWFSGATHR